ncbi:hypothetical protein CVT24_002075 [Panaeolus cyanescens]|uniref:F-box domain-containing protein n=1 Tax=Panaeolus cyanescens TaxID=181874 RepID=A0A409W1K3_9AGAR|nr:hypothetical protein CVT24_002075 [Panaeolus cyanescens]
MDDRSQRVVFTTDIWETIVGFIPNYPRRTLINLSLASKELCVVIRPRLFGKVTFTIARSTRDPTYHLEPFWSQSPRLLLRALRSSPALSKLVKHLEVEVSMHEMQRDMPPNMRRRYYNDLSITKLAPRLTNLTTLSFAKRAGTADDQTLTWISLPEEVRRAIHPLLHRVPDLRLERLWGAFAASLRSNGSSALESLTVSPGRTFEIGDTFSSIPTSLPSSAPRPHRLKSLTIDSSKFITNYADWLTIDNPAFPITINHLERLVFISLSFPSQNKSIPPDDRLYRILERCCKTLKRLEMPTSYKSAYILSMKVNTDNPASQRRVFEGRHIDLSSLVNLEFLRICGAALTCYRYQGDKKEFTTTIPYIIKVLQSLPYPTDSIEGPRIRKLHIDLEIEELKESLLRKVDWTDFADCLLNDPRFTNIREVFIDVTYIFDFSDNPNHDDIKRVRPPPLMKKVLQEDLQLKKLMQRRGLVVGSTAETPWYHW